MSRSVLFVVALAISGCTLDEPDPADVQKATPAGVLIPGATVQVGVDSTDISALAARYNLRFADRMLATSHPAHRVRIDSFRIDSVEVSNEQYTRFLAEHPEWRRNNIPDRFHNGSYLSHWPDGELPSVLVHQPVVYVSWYAAQAYCQWRGGRLPTEAEWEYAASGGLGPRPFPWGTAPPDSTRVNYAFSYEDGPVAVASYPSNEFGLYDLAGNVWEFVLDPWGTYPTSEPADVVADVLGTTSGSYESVTGRRVIRGGSWAGAPINLLTFYRDSHPPDGAGDHVGFRCAYPNTPVRS